jgi:hypothetical protein
MVLAGRAFGFTAGEDHERDIQKLRTGGFSDGCAARKHERDSGTKLKSCRTTLLYVAQLGLCSRLMRLRKKTLLKRS